MIPISAQSRPISTPPLTQSPNKGMKIKSSANNWDLWDEYTGGEERGGDYHTPRIGKAANRGGMFKLAHPSPSSKNITAVHPYSKSSYDQQAQKFHMDDIDDQG